MHRGALPRSFKVLLGIASGLIGLGVFAIGLTLLSLRDDAVRSAIQNAGNIATILANQVTHAVKELDSKLTGVAGRVTATGAETADELQARMQTVDDFFELRRQLAGLPHADIILVIGADGSLINATDRWPVADLDFSDRDYFRHLRDHDGPGLYVGLPVRAGGGTLTLHLAKRVNSRTGKFLGVVAIGVPLRYFQRIYDSISDLKGQSFLFLRRDGMTLIRYPDIDDRTGIRLPADSPWYQVAASGGGHYRSPGYFDGAARLAAVRPLRDFPLVVNVGVLESAALATWRWRATLIALGTLLAVLCTVLLLSALARQVRKLAHSEAAIAEREAGLADKSRELEQVNARLDAAVGNMSQGLCMFDSEGRLALCNQRYILMYRLSPNQTKPGCRAFELLEQRLANGTFLGDPDAYMDTIAAHIAEGEPFYSSSELPDGRVIAVSFQPVAGGGWVSTHEDITERQKVEARIAHMARHDALTQLANRVLFVERLEEAIDRLRRFGDAFAVLVFDLDLFKAVNDALGHTAGDEILRRLARRLDDCLQPGWTLARTGGDEFAVILTVESDPRAAAIGLAETIIARAGEPLEIAGQRIVLGVSVGIAMAPSDGTDSAEFLKNADLALARAKAEGRSGYRFFEAEMDAAARLRRTLEIDLRNALVRNEFELHYQPLVDIACHRVCGAEALVRWRHPDLGLVAPDRFIPIAEETGLIIPIGEWILNAACAEAAGWPEHVKLAVNLSPIQFRSPRLVDCVREALARSGLPPERLELEITESVLLQKDEGNLATLNEFAAAGVSIALDDFGTGYSSLSYLRTFRFGKIKIDRSFIAGMGEREDCSAIVGAITSLGRSLDVATTAEGVETREQLALLRAAGCGQAQGYLFSRPLPAAEINFGADYAHLEAA